jgi:hypothetical protein
MKITIKGPNDIMPAPKKTIDKWEIQSALDAMKKVSELMDDPKLMAAVKKELKSQHTAIKSIEDIKKSYDKLVMGDMPKKMGMKPEPDVPSAEDNIPPDSSVKSYKQAKASNDAMCATMAAEESDEGE